MDDLVRLVYASEATFAGTTADQGIELEVARILGESRRNNARAEVGGVLYYGNGYFFQCLEGQRDAVIATYNRISTDPRHKNAKILLKGFTKRRLFQDWSMKYLPADKNLRDFLAQHSLSEFSPFDYDHEMVGRLLILFQQAKESGELAEHRVVLGAEADTSPQDARTQHSGEQTNVTDSPSSPLAGAHSSAPPTTGWRRFFTRKG